MKQPDTQPHTAFSSRRRFAHLQMVSHLLFCLCGALLVATVETRAYYRRILELKAYAISPFDTGLVFFSLLAKTLVLLIPVILISMLLLHWQRKQLANLLVLSLAGVLFAWLVADIRLQRITGGHISDYVENVLNPDAWQWGGNLSEMLWKIGWDIVAALFGSLGLFLGLGWLMSRLVYHQVIFPRRIHSLMLSVSMFLIVAGLFPALNFVDNPLVLERLYAALPTNAWLFTPENVPRRGTAAFQVNCDQQFAELGEIVYRASQTPLPIDETVSIPQRNAPNVILVIVESFRHNAISPESMPKLAAWAKQGTTLSRHYATSNKSELGTFALLYGRSPVVFDSTLDAGIQQQASHMFQKAGYHRALIASCIFKFAKMDKFMNAENFDTIRVHSHKDEKIAWWRSDRSTLKDISQLIANYHSKPHFVVSYLMSTHYSYDYPPEYERHQTDMKRGALKEDSSKRYSIDREDLLNRYLNSLAYIDDELDKMIQSLDPKKNIVIITGDHGESFYEDGFVTHGTLLSEIQTRVPLVMVGPGIPKQIIDTPTSHVDLLPTLVHALTGKESLIENCHGSDVFGTGYQPQSLLVHKYHDSWDLMLVREEGRLKLNLRRDQPVARVLGFADDRAHIHTDLSHPASEIPFWHRQLSDHLKAYHIPSQPARISRGRNQPVERN